MSGDPLKLSFVFSKTKPASKLVKNSAISSKSEQAASQLDFVSAFEGQQAHTIKKYEDTSLVIPIIHSRVGLRAIVRKKYAPNNSTEQSPSDANKELTSGTPIEVDGSNENPGLVVPMKVNVKPEDGGEWTGGKMETEEEINVEDSDYNSIPVESFGLAMLKGMGLKEEQKGQSVDKYLSKVRLKGLGLGADPEVLKKARQEAKQQQAVNGNEKLAWKVGARCQALIGRNEGQYGVIQGFDGDTGRVIVRFPASKEVRKVMQSFLRLVPEAEFNKYSKYINKSSADRYAANEVNESKNSSKPPRNEEESKMVRKKSPLRTSFNRSRSPPAKSSSWARKGLVVRYMNKSGPDREFYKERVKIIDSNFSGSRFVCETENLVKLRDVRDRDLQTIVPKHRGDTVQIVKGKYDGLFAVLVKRDSEASKVCVELRDGDAKRIEISFDDVCSIKR